MKIEITHPDELWAETQHYIVSNRRHSFNEYKVLVSDCLIYQRGQYLIVEMEGKVMTSEIIKDFCYLADAVRYMDPSTPAKWKTVGNLMIFRRAIRENYAQGMGLEEYLQEGEGISFTDFKTFITTARVYDKRQHGQATF